MKFIADVMLGRLAKRLRLLGYDVLYDRTFDDNEVIRLALEEGRLILTRDKALSKRPLASGHLFIESDNPCDQIEQVLQFSHPSEVRPLTRCSLCNAELMPLSHTDARDLVPEHIYRTREEFFECRVCKRIYWNGTHVQRMTSFIRKR